MWQLFYSHKDFILPMRNWNITNKLIPVIESIEDFILPMRNWNLRKIWNPTPAGLWFYLTYEELKLLYTIHVCMPRIRILSYLWGIETWLLKVNKLHQDRILSYLWGIETLHIIFILRTILQDFILPMRNWNYI